MTLSIKALLPEPEVTHVRSRRDEEGRGERRQRKSSRQFRDSHDDEDVHEWSEGGIGGASIAEMLQNKNSDQ